MGKSGSSTIVVDFSTCQLGSMTLVAAFLTQSKSTGGLYWRRCGLFLFLSSKELVESHTILEKSPLSETEGVGTNENFGPRVKRS